MDSSKLRINYIEDLGKIGDNITEIIWNINHPIDILDGFINLKSITFGRDFNQPITVLQNLINLTHIIFGYRFNKTVDAIAKLPNLRHITFGYRFNCSIEEFRNLHNLRSIKFGYRFDQPIVSLQDLSNLTKISFERFYDIPFKMPENVERVKIINCNQPALICHLYINYSQYLNRSRQGFKFNNKIIELSMHDKQNLIYSIILKSGNNQEEKSAHYKPLELIEVVDNFFSGINIKRALR